MIHKNQDTCAAKDMHMANAKQSSTSYCSRFLAIQSPLATHV
jgi:hypothetical protein